MSSFLINSFWTAGPADFHELLEDIYGSDLNWDHDYQGYTAGTTIQDLTANNLDSVPTGSPPATSGPVAGDVPDLDGSTDYFEVNPGNNNGLEGQITSTKGLTIGILCRPEMSDARWLVSRRGPNSTTDYEWAIFTTGFASGSHKVATVVYHSTGAQINGETTNSTCLPQNAWALIVVSFPAHPDRTPRHSIYVNSSSAQASTQTLGTNTAATGRNAATMVGTEADNLSLKFDGQIARTFCANRDSTSGEVGQLMTWLDNEGWF